MKQDLQLAGWRPLLVAALLALMTLNPGSEAHAQGACLVLNENHDLPGNAAHQDGLGCITSLTGAAELHATWALTDTNDRPVRVSLVTA